MPNLSSTARYGLRASVRGVGDTRSRSCNPVERGAEHPNHQPFLATAELPFVPSQAHAAAPGLILSSSPERRFQGVHS